MNDLKNNKEFPRIGAFVLETLTTGMYRNPLDSLREYIQNAFDSIRAAERNNILRKSAGRIEVHMDNEKKYIVVRDNGMGVPSDEINSRLVDIGISSKSIDNDAGFRGIGRLAGIAYCDRLIFRTQAEKENFISTVTFDCSKLKSAISPSNRKVDELANVIAKHVSTSREQARKQDHFFEVRMESLNGQGEPFLDDSNVRDYLEQVAPLGFDTQSFPLAKLFHDWVREHSIQMPTVSIIMKKGSDSYELFKPYKGLTFSTKQGSIKIHVRNLRFYPEDAGPNSPFWIWYAETNCPGAFSKDTIGGFRLRKSNISIGLSDLMTDIFRLYSESYARFNKYYMGEVHIQDPSVIPNAHRDDFEDTKSWNVILQELKIFSRERSREAYELSAGRNADIEKLVSLADGLLELSHKKEAIGFASKEEKHKLLTEHEKQIKKLDDAYKSERPEKEKLLIRNKLDHLSRSKKSIDATSNFTAKKLKSSLDKKQRKVISDILTVLYEVLDSTSFQKAQEAILARYQIMDKGVK